MLVELVLQEKFPVLSRKTVTEKIFSREISFGVGCGFVSEESQSMKSLRPSSVI